MRLPWTKTDLWLTNWTVETNLVAASNQTQVTVAMNGRTNLFFLAVEDYRMTTNNFRGMDSVEAGGGVPDTMGAVGQNHFVELLNHRIAVYHKTYRTNGMQITNASIQEFFSASSTTNVFDPRILYDGQSNRWVASAIDGLNLYLAVSKSPSPEDLTTNNWWTFVIPLAASVDYDTLGMDANGIYLSMVQPVTNNHRIVAINKTNLYQGSFRTNILFVSGAEMNVMTIQPALRFDSSPLGGVAWFVGKEAPETNATYRGGAIRYRGLRWTGDVADWADTNGWRILAEPTNTYRDYFDFNGTSSNLAVRAPAVGYTNIDLGNVGSRLMNAVIRDGYLWTCQHVGLDTNGTYSGDTSGTNVSRSGLQWLKLKIETNGESLTYAEHGRFYDEALDNPLWYYFPSVMVNAAGDMLMGFSASGATNLIGAYYVWRPACGVTDKKARLIYDGEIVWGRDRLGDYSYTSLDPTDQLTFWTVQEYAEYYEDDQGPIWGTWIAEIKPKP